jgi:hypothetical protein
MSDAFDFEGWGCLVRIVRSRRNRDISRLTAPERIQEIGRRARNERASLSALQTQTDADALKQRRQKALSILNDVDALLHKIANMPTPGLHGFLDDLEELLRGVVAMREHVEGALLSLHLPAKRLRRSRFSPRHWDALKDRR